MNRFFSGPRMALFVREAWKNVVAAPVLTIVAILTISVSLIMVGLFGFAMVNGDRLLNSAVEDLSITIYLDEAVTQEDLTFLMDKIENRPEVQKAKFFSRQEDLERNLKLLDRSLIEGLDRDVIPAQPSIEINLKSADLRKGDFTTLPTWLKNMEGVQSVQELYFDAEKLRILFALIDLVRIIGLIICTIVLAAAVFFIFSTIKLAVYARQDEIEVLRLVGATDRFIRAPFYIEGAFAGLLGSGVALLIISLIHARLETFVKEEQFMNFDLHLMPAGMVVWLLAGGVILGLLGSALSVGRYLRR
jgi:cell division transport system permease protein